MKSIASIQYVSRKKTAKISVKTLREFKESVVRAIIIVIKTLKPQKSTKFLALTKDAISLSMVNVIYRTVCQLFRPFIPLYDGDGVQSHHITTNQLCWFGCKINESYHAHSIYNYRSKTSVSPISLANVQLNNPQVQSCNCC